MTATIRRHGRQDLLLAAVSSDVVDVLSDLGAVTRLLGDLLDQAASSDEAPHRWVVPPIGVGPVAIRSVLVPAVVVVEDGVRITATSVAPSTAAVRLELDMAVGPADLLDGGSEASLLTTTWRLRVEVPVPRLLLVGSRPAIDAAVTRVVDDINRRVAAAV